MPRMTTGRRLPSSSTATHLKRRAIYPESAWSSASTRWAQCSPNSRPQQNSGSYSSYSAPTKKRPSSFEATPLVPDSQDGATDETQGFLGGTCAELEVAL